MKLLRHLLQKEGWHLAETGLPIQVGVKFGASPFGKKHRHLTMAEYFLLVAGSMKLSVAGQTLAMEKGDLLVVEPGEEHEVLRCSPDALLLLLMPPPIAGDKVES
jgi:quercetin dioxygenase-like cupin family protein